MAVAEQTNVGWCIIPPWVMARSDISMTQKVLYGRILGLSEQRGYCWASNAWLASQIGVAPQTVANNLSDMAAKGLVRVELIKQGQATTRRRLFPVWPQPDQLTEIEYPDSPLTDPGNSSMDGIPNSGYPQPALTDFGAPPGEHTPNSVNRVVEVKARS